MIRSFHPYLSLSLSLSIAYLSLIFLSLICSTPYHIVLATYVLFSYLPITDHLLISYLCIVHYLKHAIDTQEI